VQPVAKHARIPARDEADEEAALEAIGGHSEHRRCCGVDLLDGASPIGDEARVGVAVEERDALGVLALEESEQIREPLGELLELCVGPSELGITHLELVDQHLGRRRGMGAQIERARRQRLDALREIGDLRAKALRGLASDCQQPARTRSWYFDHREPPLEQKKVANKPSQLLQLRDRVGKTYFG
jgi:hypothetical protein